MSTINNQPSTQVQPAQVHTVVLPPIIHEVVRPQIITEIQPVVTREIIAPTVIKTVRPFSEVYQQSFQPQPTYGWASGAGFYHNQRSAQLQPILNQQQPGIGFGNTTTTTTTTTVVQPAGFDYQPAPVPVPQPRPYSVSSSGSSSRLSGIRGILNRITHRGATGTYETSIYNTGAVQPVGNITSAPVLTQQTVQTAPLAVQQGWSGQQQPSYQQPLAVQVPMEKYGQPNNTIYAPGTISAGSGNM